MSTNTDSQPHRCSVCDAPTGCAGPEDFLFAASDVHRERPLCADCAAEPSPDRRVRAEAIIAAEDMGDLQDPDTFSQRTRDVMTGLEVGQREAQQASAEEIADMKEEIDVWVKQYEGLGDEHEQKIVEIERLNKELRYSEITRRRIIEERDMEIMRLTALAARRAETVTRERDEAWNAALDAVLTMENKYTPLVTVDDIKAQRRPQDG